MNHRKLLPTLFIILACIAGRASGAEEKLQNLRVEYAANPMTVEAEHPRFSWEMQTDPSRRGEKQTAYQIVVSNEAGEEVWNTGKVKSDVSLHVRYAGQARQPATRYTWELTVWDGKNKKNRAASWFETGLMGGSDAYRGWSGAQWIGGSPEDKNFYAPYLPVFRLHFAIRLDEASRSTRASLIYGANDERLMSRNRNIFHLENPKDSSFVRIELDIAPLDTGGQAELRVFRAGYHPQDRRDVPLKTIPLPASVLNRENRYGLHAFSLSTELGITRFYAGAEEKEIGRADLNPIGQGGDFIAFPVVGEVGFALAPGQTATFSDVRLAHLRSPMNTVLDLLPRPLQLSGGTAGLFRVSPLKSCAAPMLRTVFEAADKEIAKARLYITARGIYEVRLNGRKVGQDYFNPGLTQYNKTHLYQAFDVTSSLQAGQKNALGVQLSEGWWSGGATYTGDNWNFFGDCQSLLGKLVITYADGSQQVLTTSPETWQYFPDGPVVYGSFFQGEVYDARREAQIAGWDTPDYDASAWKQAALVPLEGNISREGSPNKPKVDDYSHFRLIGQYGPTVQAVDTLTAVSVTEPRPGVFIYDMGQNMAGVPLISLPSTLRNGQKIELRYAEILYPPLPEYEKDKGMLMLENIRAAMAQDIYIASGDGRPETISPRFTFHGYRYIEVTGLDEPLPAESVRSLVLSSIGGLTAGYSTSDSRINRLWENIKWSSLSNFLSIPTDCPQRNERLGWSGDISVFGRTATYLADVAQFLRRHLQAMRDVQREDGRFPDIAPLGGGFGGFLWGSAGITVPWECFQQYGDTALLEEHYEAMKRYIRYVMEKERDPSTGLIVQSRAWGDLGDWLGLEDSRNDKSLIWESYLIYDLELMERMAGVLGKTEDAARFGQLRSERKDFFRRTYLQPGTGKTIHSAFDPKQEGKPVDTQTSYVLPLAFGIVEGKEKELLTQNLVNTILRENRTDQGKDCPPYSLMTGFIGTARISQALSEAGRTDLAYRLLQQSDYPSWLYSVEQGATTIWERLNSYTHTDGFGGNNRMNSFNHYSFGAVGAWMYAHSLGIRRDENAPGFKHFLLKPETDPAGEMTHAEGFYDSPYGRIESSWRIGKKSIVYRFTVPANTTATLYLPAGSSEQITESGRPLRKSRGIEPTGLAEDGMQIMELSSGCYEFEVAKP